MSIFRTTMPEKGNPYYNSDKTGGYSQCIIINEGRVDGLNVLKNCVGYSCGCFNELIAKLTGKEGMRFPTFYNDAHTFVQRAKELGLNVADHPMMGGIMVYDNDGGGHVVNMGMKIDDDHFEATDSERWGEPFRSYVLNSDNDWCPPSPNEYYYNHNTKFLGCVCLPEDAQAILDELLNPKPEPEPEPEPTKPLKFKVGDRVLIDGALYRQANAEKAAGSVSNKVTTITRVVEGSAHPYNTTGDLGWMNEEDVFQYNESKIEVGSYVRVKTTRDYNGHYNDDWVLKAEFIVNQIDNDRVVLHNINDELTGVWNIADIELA